MLDLLVSVFDSTGFPPRWRCGAWSPAHGWLHILSDLGVWSAYFAIPLVLWHFARRRADLPFRHLFWLFGAFILLCGTTHLMEAVIFWWPAYRLAGLLKLLTALVSWATVLALVPVVPRALALRSPEELAREVDARRKAEGLLAAANADLERRVRERTDELTRANAELRAERERFRTTLASIGDAVIATDTAGRVTFLNPAAQANTGWGTAEAVGRPIAEVFRIVDETARTPVANPALRALREGRVVGLADHTVLIGRDGAERPIDDCAAPIRDAAGGVSGAVLVFRDVTEGRQAEAALRLRDRAIQAVPHGLAIADATAPDLPLIYVSPGFERLTGYRADEVAGRNCRFLQGPDTDPGAVARVRAAIAAGRPVTVELLNYRKDGTPFWNELTVSPVRDAAGRLTHFVGLKVDVTERRRLAEQYRQAQKLEAVGGLAAGVAHDFNNLLTVVSGCGELLRERLPADDPARPLVDDMVRAAERGAGLTRQLLAFGRRQMVRARVFEPADAARAALAMVGRLLGEDVHLVADLDPAAGAVRADPGQFDQVLLNLAVNARDAMPTGGTLAVEVGRRAVPAGGPLPAPDARPGEYVVLAVSDTGMPPEVQARAFEPFFTTKGVGQGTGLGLATVYGIARQADGFVTLATAADRGTTVAVHWPRHDADPAAVTPAPAALPPPAGGELVLVVEDDAAVRGLTANILRRQGYRVEAAADGAAAWAACDRLAGPPAVLVTDVVMPGGSGRELADRLTARYPGLRVVYVSGYTTDAVLRHGVREDTVTLLQKPFTRADLLRAVRDALTGR